MKTPACNPLVVANQLYPLYHGLPMLRSIPFSTNESEWELVFKSMLELPHFLPPVVLQTGK